VAVLQHGVEHSALAGPLAGPAALLPAIVWCPSETVSPGRVRQRGPAHVTVPDGAAGAGLAALLDGSARVERVADFRTTAWRKLCLDATAAPMVIAGRRAELFGDPEQLALARRLAEECVAVGRAEGAHIGPETVADGHRADHGDAGRRRDVDAVRPARGQAARMGGATA
jgi:2-dehydropantoate 2-reductase